MTIQKVISTGYFFVDYSKEINHLWRAYQQWVWIMLGIIIIFPIIMSFFKKKYPIIVQVVNTIKIYSIWGIVCYLGWVVLSHFYRLENMEGKKNITVEIVHYAVYWIGKLEYYYIIFGTIYALLKISEFILWRFKKKKTKEAIQIISNFLIISSIIALGALTIATTAITYQKRHTQWIKKELTPYLKQLKKHTHPMESYKIIGQDSIDLSKMDVKVIYQLGGQTEVYTGAASIRTGAKKEGTITYVDIPQNIDQIKKGVYNVQITLPIHAKIQLTGNTLQ